MSLGVLEYDHNDFIRQRAGDEKLVVRFFRKALKDEAKSLEEGRPIFVERDFIQIMTPGDKSTVIVRPVKPGGGDALRFAKQYDHWKATQTNLESEGMPLEVWGKLSLAQIEEYRYFGIRTVEQLAELRDDIALKIPGSMQLKQKAATLVQLTKEEAPVRKVMAELEQRDETIEMLRHALEEQGARLKALEAAKE